MGRKRIASRRVALAASHAPSRIQVLKWTPSRRASFSDATATHEPSSTEYFEESQAICRRRPAAHPLDLHAGEGLQPDEEFIEETLVDEGASRQKRTGLEETLRRLRESCILSPQLSAKTVPCEPRAFTNRKPKTSHSLRRIETSDEPEGDASASHHVDPTASQRLPSLRFWRKEEEGRR